MQESMRVRSLEFMTAPRYNMVGVIIEVKVPVKGFVQLSATT